MRGWRLGRDGILRPMIGKALVRFWDRQDADLWVNQRLLVTHVLQELPQVDKDTIRLAIDRLQREGVFLRCRPSPRRTIYRLAPRFADPTSPGYAREVDDLLVAPIPWVSARGQFVRVGLAVRDRPRLFPVAAFPHHFAKHTWMRAWIHAIDAGWVSQAAPTDALAVAARLAPADLVLALVQQGHRPGPIGEAGRAILASQIFVRPASAATAESATLDQTRLTAEHALRLLHALCGHAHLSPLMGEPALPRLAMPFPPDWVYEQLDRMVLARVRESAPSLPLTSSFTRRRSPEQLGAQEVRLLARVEPVLRSLGPARLGEFTNHWLAWSRGPQPTPPRARASVQPWPGGERGMDRPESPVVRMP